MNEQFWRYVCVFTSLWRMLMMINTVVIVLIGLSLLVIEPGTGSYYVSILTLAAAFPMLTSSIYFIKKCVKRREGGQVGRNDNNS